MAVDNAGNALAYGTAPDASGRAQRHRRPVRHCLSPRPHARYKVKITAASTSDKATQILTITVT
jgi:hypothetical protein